MTPDAGIERRALNEQAPSAPAAVDPDHADLMALVDDIEIAVDAGVPPGQVACAVAILLERVGTDLTHEERVMGESHYPLSVEHECAHRQFAHELSRIASEFLADTEAVPVTQVLGCVRHWLRGHGPEHDSRLAAFLLTAGHSPVASG